MEKSVFARKAANKAGIISLCFFLAIAFLTGCGDKTGVDEKWLLQGEHKVPDISSENVVSPTGSALTLSVSPTSTAAPTTTPSPKATATPTPTTGPKATATPTPTTGPKATATPTPTTESKATATPTPTTEAKVTTTPAATPTPAGALGKTGGKLVVIDAGHQRKGNNDTEPDGPGSSTTKAKVSAGTTGHYTGIPEYELNLAVAKKVEAILKARGYRVIMVRDTHDVDISNSERAEVANKAGADVFVRIHANANDNSEVNGAETLCQTKDNPYNSKLYPQSRKLSQSILDAICAECGCKKRHVVETDTMSGINWCQVPVTIVEMGFMTNEKEDRLMATEEYRDKLAKGIADGIDAYFAGE